MTPSTQRISMWSGPRNISTAMMYSFAQRRDTQVVDEPLYGHYLRLTHAPHPGADEVLASLDCDGERVVREVMLGPTERPVLFCKNMAHHLVGLDWGFLGDITNILLTRHPREMLPSLAKNITPSLRDTGYDLQVELFKTLHDQGQTPPVIDSREMLLHPESVLRQLCQQIDLPFDEAMLSWAAGPRPEDGVWAKYWYHSLHQSTGFAPYRPKIEPFPNELRPLLEECLPYYDLLAEQAIRGQGKLMEE